MSFRLKAPLDAQLIEEVAQFPSSAIARAWRNSGGGWTATVDCGSESRISDAVPLEYAASEEVPCDKIKQWLLDDLASTGRLGKRQFQPHWSSYDIKYRLMEHWKTKLQPDVQPSAFASGLGL